MEGQNDHRVPLCPFQVCCSTSTCLAQLSSGKGETLPNLSLLHQASFSHHLKLTKWSEASSPSQIITNILEANTSSRALI